MIVELKDLKETTKNISDLEPYLGQDGNAMGFLDTDGQFKMVVNDNGKLYKKRVPKRSLS